MIDKDGITAEPPFQASQRLKETGAWCGLRGVPGWIIGETAVEQVEAAQIVDFEGRRRQSPNLGRAE